MKLFRRISALALAVVMICLLSVSAFAVSEYQGSYSHMEEFNDDSKVSVWANLTQSLSIAAVEISCAPGLEESDLSISNYYSYINTNGNESWWDAYAREYNTEVCYLRLPDEYSPQNIAYYTKVYYNFDATYTALGVEYSYHPATVTIVP